MRQLRTYIMHVEDLPGVLNRVTSLFRRRGYNIDSLAVGRSEVPGVSRMTIVMEADDDAARRIEANLYKLVNVLKVDGLVGVLASYGIVEMVRTGAVAMLRSTEATDTSNQAEPRSELSGANSLGPAGSTAA